LASLRLTGERADGYVAALRRLRAVGRPGAQFPDARRVDAHLSFLGPAGSRGTSDGIDVDPETGMPALRELLRVRADRDLAERFLVEHGDTLPAKAAYYRALAAADVMPTTALDVRLRSAGKHRASFEVVHDRLDAAAGCFLRYTIHLEQRGETHVALRRGDLSAPTARFQALAMRYASADAEVAFLLFAELDDVRVTEVTRGQLGPLHFRGVPAPALVEEALAAAPDGFVLHLPLERAALDVAEDRCRDPFARMYRDALGPDARAAVEARRGRLGYRVAKDRRLACTPGLEAPLTAALGRAGARLVVRSR
jgi:hypothetical protein